MLNGFKFVIDPASTPNEMTLESTCILQYFVISKLLRVDFALEPNELVSLLPDSDLVVTSSTYFNSLIKIFNITGINEGKFICNNEPTDTLSIDKMIKIFSTNPSEKYNEYISNYRNLNNCVYFFLITESTGQKIIVNTKSFQAEVFSTEKIVQGSTTFSRPSVPRIFNKIIKRWEQHCLKHVLPNNTVDDLFVVTDINTVIFNVIENNQRIINLLLHKQRDQLVKSTQNYTIDDIAANLETIVERHRESKKRTRMIELIEENNKKILLEKVETMITNNNNLDSKADTASNNENYLNYFI